MYQAGFFFATLDISLWLIYAGPAACTLKILYTANKGL